MKGKLGFVLGAAVGYVLGTRAGRARYEQIKRGANAVWETPLVQQGVSSVKESVGDGVEVAKSAVFQLLKNVFDAASQQSPRKDSNGARPAGTADHTQVASATPAEEKPE